jgi:hypothetical protein
MREDVIAASCAIDHISLLDMSNDKEKIKELLAQAIDLAGDNFDVLQICVLIYLGLSDIQQAKMTIRKLVNENYNTGLNGLLLSRIYCKYDKNRAEYDILEKRIGKNNIMPWFEDDDESAKQYIEYRKKDAVWRFGEFLKDITIKYSRSFEKLLGYDETAKPKNKLEWFLDINIIECLVYAFNDYFTDLANLGILDQCDNNKNAHEYLKEQASNISTQIEKFNADYREAKTFVATDKDKIFSSKKTVYEKCLKIDQIIKEGNFFGFARRFVDTSYIKFNDHFSVKSSESADQIMALLNEWYNKNNINIPINERKIDFESASEKKSLYFDINRFSMGND